MAVNKVVLGEETLLDLTSDTVTADKLLKGYTAHDMKGEVIVGTYAGGSSPEPTDNTAVIFADYDGTLIATWTKEEISSKTALPTVPDHSGLVFEGWNWTLEDIQTDTTGQVITVGPFYHTESGLTEIDVEASIPKGITITIPTDASHYSYLDWGDGTIITTPADNPIHTYSQAGNYTIKVNFIGTKGSTTPTPSTCFNAIRYQARLVNTAPESSYAEYITIPSDMSWVGTSFTLYKAKQITFAKDGLRSSYVSGNNLAYIAIPKTFTETAKNSLGCGQKCKYVYIPSSATSIPDSIFYKCSLLQSITIPKSVTSIGIQAFASCKSLQSITIPEGVTSISSSVFNGCTSLRNITIPDSVTFIGSSAFNGCSSLESIVIPESVNSIGQSAFSGCRLLQSITLPSTLTSVDSSTFSNCSALQSITLPSTVNSIGASVFYGCSALDSIVIPEGETSISSSVFSNCTSLRNITIPDSVTSIGSSAFNGCSSLESIVIPESVTSISQSAFKNCQSIYWADIRTSAKITANTYNFSNSKGSKFDFSSCSSIPVLSATSGLGSISYVTLIIVPDSLYDSWIAATNWSTFASKIKKHSEVYGETEVT